MKLFALAVSTYLVLQSLAAPPSAQQAAKSTIEGIVVRADSNEPIAGGCDTGLYVAVQGIVIQDHTTCQPQCLPVAVRSPDYKSAGAPGPAPCSGDLLCPDARVSMADYTWFASHYPTADNPGAPYFSCADFGAPFVPPISLNDYSRFVIHYAGAGHKCSL